MKTQILKKIHSGSKYYRQGDGSFIRLKDGRIMYVYVRHEGEDTDIDNPSKAVAIYSSDEGKTWSRPSVVLDPEKYGAKSISGISLVRFKKGDIGMFFMLRKTPGWINKICLVRSKNEGKTFARFNGECAFWLYDGYYVLQNDSVRMLSTGRVVIPLTFHTGSWKSTPDAHVEKRAYVGFTYSDDDGKTWQTSTDEVYQTFSNTDTGLQHASIIEVLPETLRATYGTDMGCQYTSFSTDDGSHWTPAEPTRFTSPCSPMKIIKNESTGKFYGVWNPVPDYNGRLVDDVTHGYSSLAIAELSEDTLRIKKLDYIVKDAASGNADPSLMFLNKKELLIAYNSGRSNKKDGYKSEITIAKIELDKN